MTHSFSVVFLTLLIEFSLQDCPEESVRNITWPSSTRGMNIASHPLCYRYDRLITRSCNGTHWQPRIDEVEPCFLTTTSDSSKCPPGHHPISETSDYCFQINAPSAWNYPCYKQGRPTVITDLDEKDVIALLATLNATAEKYYWLPAQRSKLFNPVIWHVPGPNWGRVVEANSSFLQMRPTMMKNCLLLDVEQKIVLTEICNLIYPSLCFSVNKFRDHSSCPDGYYGFQFMPDDTICYGIEESDNNTGLTFDEFVQTKCPNPSPNNNEYNLALKMYLFSKLAKLKSLNKSTWCWFRIIFPPTNNNLLEDQSDISRPFQGIINRSGTLSMTNLTSKKSCMACEVEIKFKESEFIFEYDDTDHKMHLTIYYPSGLWKYDTNDKGVQCFSNAKGFVNVIEVNDEPILQVRARQINDLNELDKIVYEIDPVTLWAAQYWCEGHTKNFSLVTTDKLFVNPNCDEEHVFAIVIEVQNVAYDVNEPDVSILISNITEIFNASKVLVMDILDFSTEYMLLLLHLHVAISDNHDEKGINTQETFVMLKDKAESELPKYNYTFINISSSIYCLPTTSDDIFELNWDLTPIGHIAAPRQFCLQNNGLPVKRQCDGSYLFGGIWGDVEGTCDCNYQASWTTKFLFDFVKGNIPDNDTTYFLTNGLGTVLKNGDNMIPADIYYLSMSLQHVLYLVKSNKTVDMGDIDNMAWVMDKVMSLDQSYLRLSQTLNSTNVILDSVNDIIEHLVEEHTDRKKQKNYYFLSVKPQFITQVSYPHFNNITGIAIINHSCSGDFGDMLVQPLFKNTTLHDVLSIQNLEIATWLPDEILESMNTFSNDTSKEVIQTNDELYIVINVFYNDAVFQEVYLKQHEINSRVIGISVPGYTSNLKHAIPLIFKELKASNDGHTFCGYWNFLKDTTRNVPGLWAKEGCFPYKSLSGMTVCKCYHLTHFGQLINAGSATENHEVRVHHKKVLNIITLVGSFLSLAGIAGIWITASVFSAWRQKAGTKVLLHLSTAIALPLIFLVVFNIDTSIIIYEDDVYKVADHKKVACIFLGALLHYSILASFMWMLITAVLQFVRYVRVLGVRRPSRFMMKCTTVGWGVPIIPVCVILLVDKYNYIPESTQTELGRYLICYPKGFILIMSVIFPIGMILAVNIILFLVVMHSIYRGPDGKMRTTDMDLIGAQFRLSIFLFFLLGLTWIFGILSFTNNFLWSYMFCLTSTIQGFVLFVYFIVCDPATRNMWISLMTPNFTRTGRPRESITSISSG